MNWCEKGIVLILICSFIGSGIIPSISGNFREDGNDSIRLESIKDVSQDGSKTASSSQGVDWWPMFHHDLQHSGYSTSDAPETSNVKWSYTTGGWVSSSPAVADGKVYIGSGDHKVYCLDGANGDFIWYYTTGDGVYSSPAVADGKVYIGSDDWKVYCLDGANGDFIWYYTTGFWVYSSPAVCDGKVYFGSYDYKVYCLDAATGDFIWSYITGGDVYSSPAVADGKVYFGSHDNKVYCLDAATGDLIWFYTTGGCVGSSPAVADGKVYVGSDDNKVYCLDAATGDFIWSYITGGDVYSSPAVADGKVYVGSGYGTVYCLDAATGDLIWFYTTGGCVGSSPAVADGKVYVGSDDNKVYCLDAATGDFIWSYTTGDYVYSSPAVCDGKVYIGSDDHKVYCFEDSGNQPPNTPSTPSGPIELNTGVSGTYSASATDPDGDQVQYQFDWDADGSHDYSSWTTLGASGHVDSLSHSWGSAGTYTVKAQARDEHGATSVWSSGLSVVVSEIPNTDPDTPDKPFGATSVIVHHNHRYQTSAVDPDSDRVQYYFDWGDGKGDWTGFVDSGEDEGYDHVWREPGVYQVKARARDDHGAESGWSEPLTVTVEEEVNHQPNKPNKPSGQESGKAGVKYTYSTSAVDPDGDQIKYYLWDWGDGVEKRTPVYGPFESGETTSAEHAWDEKGNYQIRVYAIDVNGAQSYPSETLIVSMPKGKPFFDSLFWFFGRILERFPFLEQTLLNFHLGGS